MTQVSTARAGAAVALATVALGALVLDVVSNVGDHGLRASDLIIWLAFGSAAIMGTLVALARPANRVGWAMLIGATLSAVGGAAIDVAHRHVLHGTYAPAPSALILMGSVARGYGWSITTIVVVSYFPDGTTLPGRWRLIPRLAMVGMTLMSINSLFDEHANLTDLPQWRNPLSTPFLSKATGPLSLLGIMMYAVLLGFSVAQLVTRFRRGDSMVRQQIGLLAAVALLPVVAVVVGVLTGDGLLFGLTVLPLPIAVGFAVLARGLYDLPTAANRSLVWLLLSAAIVAIYALMIVGVGGHLKAPGARWLPWVAACAVALAFAPLRDALQRAANRVTFGRWDDPRSVIATLGQHLEAAADADRLLTQAVVELRDTLRLSDLAVIDADGIAVAGEPGGRERVPAMAYDQLQGHLEYSSPTTLRRSDRRLIADLAAHVAVVLHSRRLTADLQKTRERLVIAREEERRRLRRDLHDGLGPALAGHLLRVDLVARKVSQDSPARNDLEILREDLRCTVADLRRVVEGLRPPALDEIGLAGAVAATVDKLIAPTRTAYELDTDQLPPLSAAVEVAAYRIVVEALTNVAKHAQATTCRISLTTADDELVVAITDDGRGGDGVTAGHGRDTMRERAEELGGSLDIDGSKGTRVTARLPIVGRTPDDQGPRR